MQTSVINPEIKRLSKLKSNMENRVKIFFIALVIVSTVLFASGIAWIVTDINYNSKLVGKCKNIVVDPCYVECKHEDILLKKNITCSKTMLAFISFSKYKIKIHITPNVDGDIIDGYEIVRQRWGGFIFTSLSAAIILILGVFIFKNVKTQKMIMIADYTKPFLAEMNEFPQANSLIPI